MSLNFRISVAATLFAVSLPAFSQISGAIYTSLENGDAVNANLFTSKESVYLNGGPQNQNSAGLPNGVYYYQVTDPSGAPLLSSDNAVCRQLLVAGGKVSGATGPACKHASGTQNSTNGSIPVQLVDFDNTPNGGGVYKVWLISTDPAIGCGIENVNIDTINPKVLNFPSSCAKTDNFRIAPTVCTTNCQPSYTLSGNKFYDANGNGLNDAEPPVQGFKIDVTVAGAGFTRFTDVDGLFAFSPVYNGESYVVCEASPLPTTGVTGAYWQQTSPAVDSTFGDRCYRGTVGDANIGNLSFGNVCLAPGTGGYTLGFWSNRNGEIAFNGISIPQSALAGLVALNLRNANGTDFNPANYAAFKTWLLSGTATNMAYMLSVQMSATWLNVASGRLNGSTVVESSSLGFTTINALIAAANTELGLHGTTLSGDAFRAYQEKLKNDLDKINNNILPTVQAPGTCQVIY